MLDISRSALPRVLACPSAALLALVASACARHATADRTSELRDTAAPPMGLVDADVTVANRDAGNGDAANGDGGDGDDDSADGDGGSRAPLAGYPELLELTDGNDKLGFVSVPLGAREPRPIMVAIHGGSERPERACAAWRGVTDAYPFVVCPRGFGGIETRLGWRTTADTTARIARAVEATKKIFGPRVRTTTTTVLAGFSMGGSQVARLARQAPQIYRRIVVGDSAHDPWPALTFSRSWAAGGGERALFLCTTSGCEPSFRAAARNVAKEHAPARLNIAATQVHGLSAGAVQSMRRDFPWLVEGAEGWATYVAASDLPQPGRTENFDPN